MSNFLTNDKVSKKLQIFKNFQIVEKWHIFFKNDNFSKNDKINDKCFDGYFGKFIYTYIWLQNEKSL